MASLCKIIERIPKYMHSTMCAEYNCMAIRSKGTFLHSTNNVMDGIVQIMESVA